MALITKSISGELENTCTCVECEACECTYHRDDDVCPDCGGELTFYDCGGSCYEDARGDLVHWLNEWAYTDGHALNGMAVYGSGMGWLRQSGHTGRLEGGDDVVEQLSINTQLILRWTYDQEAGSFVIVRSSHDEMGARFELRAWNEGDDE